MTAEPLYVYGVVARADQKAVLGTGVDGSPVETVEHGEFAALTSRVRHDTLRAARELRAHWSVLQQACEDATVVPVRFGTVLEDEQAVRERLLEANAQYLDELLRQLRGCIQMTLKATYVEDRVLRDVVRSSPVLSGLAARVRQMPQAAAYYERIRLGEAIAEALAQRRARDQQRALEVLEPAATATRVEESPGSLDTLSLAFLVKRTRERAFSKRVRGLMNEFEGQIEFRYIGPLPPYSFAEGELAAGGA